MNKIEVQAADQQIFCVRHWPHPAPRARLQILHGMAEHCERYQPLAEFLHQHGVEVIAHNHRGHGERGPAGHFADQDGWNKVLADVSTAQQVGNPQVPLYLLGHSMGSFIARSWAARHGERLQGLLLSGSNQQPPGLFYLGRSVAWLLQRLQGGQHLSGVMNWLSFAAFNKPFQPARTGFDWLSRNPRAVDQYMGDPQCGHLCSLQLWQDVFGGLIEISRPASARQIPATLPLYLFGGDMDPVGRLGQGLPALAQLFAHTGHDKVTLRLYPEGRHEMLNEQNASDVFNDLLQWLNQQLPA